MAALRVDTPDGLVERLAWIARDRAPHEACGLLVGCREHGRVVVEYATQGANLTSATDRFELDPMHVVTEDARARSAGREIVAVWHSHPEAPAEPSAADRRGAAREWLTAIVSLAGDEPELRFWEDEA